MSPLLHAPDLVLPLRQDVLVRAVREEVWVELGLVPVRAGHDPALIVVLRIQPQAGRGTWTPGLWWPDEPEARWGDDERRLVPEALALPLYADTDGVERYVRVMVRLRPLGPARRAEAWFSAEARIPV